MAELRTPNKSLGKLDPSRSYTFEAPRKQIHDGDDVSLFLASTAYADIMTWLLQLNASMFPTKTSSSYQAWSLDESDFKFSETVQKLRSLLEKLGAIIDEVPPDPGPRRFGNISFRKWYEIVESRLPRLLEEALPASVLSFGKTENATASAKDELQAYLYGSFGSAQRLDYGTGHELSFLAFLACIWKLGAFAEAEPGLEERGIVIGVIEPYLALIRRLILTYTLEPAGTHGVWGLDDHFFVPYIFGSAQLSPPITSAAEIPGEGSLPDAPDPGGVAKANVVQRERKSNMYFSAIGFIYDVKKGPFWEHSPILFDVSGVKAGWAKINKGMLKMYNAEVLSKFPVVQHFPFGSLFRWEKDPTAAEVQKSIHTTNQPSRTPPAGQPTDASQRLPAQEGTRAPWAAGASAQPMTAAPWASNAAAAPPMTAAPWAVRSAPGATGARGPPGATSILPPPAGAGTAAPWAQTARPRPSGGNGGGAAAAMPPTQAPWARKEGS